MLPGGLVNIFCSYTILPAFADIGPLLQPNLRYSNQSQNSFLHLVCHQDVLFITDTVQSPFKCLALRNFVHTDHAQHFSLRLHIMGW